MKSRDPSLGSNNMHAPLLNTSWLHHSPSASRILWEVETGQQHKWKDIAYCSATYKSYPAQENSLVVRCHAGMQMEDI